MSALQSALSVDEERGKLHVELEDDTSWRDRECGSQQAWTPLSYSRPLLSSQYPHFSCYIMARPRKQALPHESGALATKSTRTPSPSSGRATSPSSLESERPIGPLSTSVSSTSREVVKVNNASSSELKNACDDAVKRVSRRSVQAHVPIRGFWFGLVARAP